MVAVGVNEFDLFGVNMSSTEFDLAGGESGSEPWFRSRYGFK